jgi:hypothetical protein
VARIRQSRKLPVIAGLVCLLIVALSGALLILSAGDESPAPPRIPNAPVLPVTADRPPPEPVHLAPPVAEEPEFELPVEAPPVEAPVPQPPDPAPPPPLPERLSDVYGDVAGRVVDTDGNGVSGLSVTLRDAGGEPSAHPAVTAEDGSFLVRFVEPGWNVVRLGTSVRETPLSKLRPDVSYLSAATVSVEVTAGETSDIGELQVSRKTTIHGKVRGPEGSLRQTICSAPAVITGTADWHEDGEVLQRSYRWESVNGSFQIHTRFTGKLVLTLTADGYEPRTVTAEVPDGGELDLGTVVLTRGTAWRARFVDADTLEPLRHGQPTVEYTLKNGVDSDAPSHSTSSRLVPAAFRNRPVVLTFRIDGCQEHSVEATFRSGEHMDLGEIAIKPWPRRTLNVRLVNPDGEPFTTQPVRVQRRETTTGEWPHRRIHRTNEHGVVPLVFYVESEVELRIAARGHATRQFLVEFEDDADTLAAVTITLTPVVTPLRLRVRYADGRASGGPVRIRIAGSEHFYGSLFDTVADSRGVVDIPSTELVSYDGLSFRVTVSVDGYEPATKLFPHVNGVLNNAGVITLKPRITGTLRMVLVDPEGVPISGRYCVIHDPQEKDRMRFTLPEDGRVEITGRPVPERQNLAVLLVEVQGFQPTLLDVYTRPGVTDIGKVILQPEK